MDIIVTSLVVSAALSTARFAVTTEVTSQRRVEFSEISKLVEDRNVNVQLSRAEADVARGSLPKPGQSSDLRSRERTSSVRIRRLPKIRAPIDQRRRILLLQRIQSCFRKTWICSASRGRQLPENVQT